MKKYFVIGKPINHSLSPKLHNYWFKKNNIEATYEKIRELRNLIDENKASTLIEIDGGVSDLNANQLVAAGADVLVAGSYVFSATEPTATIANLSAQINS